jgi:acyl-Coa thioesterase superfamily protein/acyl-CoA thioesterase superfamily protein
VTVSSPEPEPLFTPDGGRFVPSEHTRGPWDPHHQHGGPVAALVARAAEAEVGSGFTVTRLTIELQRPVPLSPLTVTAQVTKPGRRVVRVEVAVEADDETVVQATAVAIRHADLPVGDDAPDDGRTTVPGPGPDVGTSLGFGVVEGPVFHSTGMEVRIVAGQPGRPGPKRAWFRLARPVVAGEEPSGLQRAAAAADFSNGLSWMLPYERWVFLNPDLTVHLARPPEGKWIALDATTLVSDQGTALAEGILYDRAGRLGRSAQSLILESRVAE